MSDEVTDVYIGFVCSELNCITVKYLLIRSCYTQNYKSPSRCPLMHTEHN